MPVAYGDAQTTGGAAPVTVACAPAAGTLFPAGTTTVTCAASDIIGQTASCTFGVTVTTIPMLLETRFMTFGDSLTEGKLSAIASILVDAGPHSYPSMLFRLLNDRYSGQGVSVVNEGFGGERAAQSLPRFRAALSAHRPGAVLLMHGVNDLNSERPGRVQSAADGIEELTKEALRSRIRTFVATLPPLGPGPKAGCPECVEPLNDLLRRMAAAKGAVLVDVYAAWGTRNGLMGADGIHPTEAGYDVIARRFLEAIRLTLEAGPGTR